MANFSLMGFGDNSDVQRSLAISRMIRDRLAIDFAKGMTLKSDYRGPTWNEMAVEYDKLQSSRGSGSPSRDTIKT